MEIAEKIMVKRGKKPATEVIRKHVLNESFKLKREKLLMEKVFWKKGMYEELVEDPFNLN